MIIRFLAVAQTVKNLPAIWETWVQYLGREDPLEKGMATHSSILAWRIPWTEKPGLLQPMGSQRVGHDWMTNTYLLTYDYTVQVRNRFKGLDLIDRVPEEVWTEVCNIVQEVVIKTIPPKKEMQKGKMVVWGSLTNSWERREAKGKGEKERYIHLNAEFQRIARRDKKAFLSD